MKKRIIKTICATALACMTVILFTGAAESREAEDIRTLLQKRTFIMENVLFGRITYEEGSRLLRKIETESMYQKDMAALLDYKNTDLAAAERMDIISLTKKSEVYDRISYEAHIKWTESYGEGTETQVCLYEVGVKKNDGCLVLSAFDIR